MPTLEQARAWYDPLDPVHGFDHVQRVLALAEQLGGQLGADLEVVRAAALLHDAAGAAPDAPGGNVPTPASLAASGGELPVGELSAAYGDDQPADEHAGGRATHEQRSAEFARQVLEGEGWPAERIAAVQHCIRAHRYRSAEAPRSVEAQVLFDADKLDVLGAFGVARTIGYALQAGQPIYAEPSAGFLEYGTRASGEAHSAYHEYLFKLRHVSGRLHTDPARRMAQARHAVMRSFFEQLAAEAHGEI